MILERTRASKGLHHPEDHIRDGGKTPNYICPSSYNMIIRKDDLNLLGVVLSTLYLCIKYLLPQGCAVVTQGGSRTFKRCYLDNLRLKREIMNVAHVQSPDTQEVNVMDMKPGADPKDDASRRWRAGCTIQEENGSLS